MAVDVQHGWVYLDEPVGHPAVSPYRDRYRFHLQPEVVDAISRQVDLSGALDVEFYRKWNKRLHQADKIRQAPPRSLLNGYDFKAPPFEHQYTAIAFGLFLPSFALFAETGTGKTYIALQIADIRSRRGQVDRTLVVAPQNTLWTTWHQDCRDLCYLDDIIVHSEMDRYQWDCAWCERECYSVSRSHARDHYRDIQFVQHLVGDEPVERCKDVDIDHLESYVPPPREMAWNDRDTLEETLEDGYDVYITSWGHLQHYPDLFASYDWGMVVLDESSKIKDGSSDTAEAAHQLGHQATYRIAMTGTPQGNHLEDLWSQMYFVDQSLGPNVTDFRKRYLHRPAPTQYPNFWVEKYDGVRDEVIERIQNRCLRITKDEALELPERDEIEVSVDLSPTLEHAYEQMSGGQYVNLEGDTIVAHHDMTERHKLQQITNGFVITDEEGHYETLEKRPPKLDALLEILGDRPEEQAIIWGQYRPDFDLIGTALDEEGVGYTELHGETTGRTIDRNIRSFQNDDDVRVMLAHPQSAMFGITLNEATLSIYYSYSYDVIEYMQSRARNYRLGQNDRVREYILIGSPQDREVFEALKSSERQARSMANDRSFRTILQHAEEIDDA